MAGTNCDYMAIDDHGWSWVRYEYCQVVATANGIAIKIGIRDQWRTSVKTEQAPCRDRGQAYVRYQIGKDEWICILPR